MLTSVWSKGNNLLLVGVKTGAHTIKINVVIPQEDGNRFNQDSAIPLLGIFQKDFHPTSEILVQPYLLLRCS